MSLRRFVLVLVLLLFAATGLASALGCTTEVATPSANSADLPSGTVGDSTPASPASAPIETAASKSTEPDPTATSSYASTSTSLSIPSGSAEAPVLKYPSIKPSRTETSASTATIIYGEVPEDFIPAVPLPETLGKSVVYITMDQKSTIGSLTRVTLQRFPRTGYGYNSDPLRFRGTARSIIREDYNGIYNEEAMLLKCGYKNSDPGLITTKAFWFGSTPSPADPDRLRSRLPEHPILKNVLGALSQCPASATAALRETLKQGPEIEGVFAPLAGNWDHPPRLKYKPGNAASYYIEISYWATGYIHLKFLRTSDDGERDVYQMFDYNTTAGIPQLMTEGTLTVDADGNGYMEAPDCSGCINYWGGEIDFTTPNHFSATLNNFSPSGEKRGRVVEIKFNRRQ